MDENRVGVDDVLDRSPGSRPEHVMRAQESDVMVLHSKTRPSPSATPGNLSRMTGRLEIQP